MGIKRRGKGVNWGRVLKLAVFSRLLVLSLFVLWRTLASPYDTSAALNPPCLDPNQGNSALQFIFVSGLLQMHARVLSYSRIVFHRLTSSMSSINPKSVWTSKFIE